MRLSPRPSHLLFKMSANISLPIIGWREWLTLPDLGISRIKAKTDTGARSSALHTHDYRVFTENGIEMVRFHIHPLKKANSEELECILPVSGFREVKDSGGHSELRPFIKTTAKIGDIEWTIDVSLTNRERMKFRMLLGRAAISDHFIVDPSQSYLLGSKH
ncbi:MAG: hypothetical protein ACI8UO_000497 [Verrucomicrobiales bacterium]|jgi:hypothetical protein